MSPKPEPSPASESDRNEGPDGPSSASSRLITIAHRAGNDRAALERALAAGVDAVEADLRWDTGRIVARHARRLPFLPVFWDRWCLGVDRDRAVTLDELLEGARGRARPYLDLKSLVGPFANALLETLGSHGAMKEVQVSSHHWRLLDDLRRAQPELDIVRSVGSRSRLAALLALPPSNLRQGGVAIRHDLLDEEAAHALRSWQLTLYVWGVKSVEEATALAAWGVTGIIADSLDLLRTLGSGRTDGAGCGPTPPRAG